MTAKKAAARKAAPKKSARAKKPRRTTTQLSPERRAKRRATFLADLAEGFSVKRAAEAQKLDRMWFYEERRADEDFAKAWDEAIEAGSDMMEDEARRRAIEGITEPVGWFQGSPGGYVQRYSDNLLMFLLKGRRPEKFRENHSVDVKGQLNLQDLTDEQLAAKLRSAIAADPDMLKGLLGNEGDG